MPYEHLFFPNSLVFSIMFPSKSQKTLCRLTNWFKNFYESAKGQDEEEKRVLTLSHTWNYYKTVIITTEGIVTGSSNETEEKAPNRSTYIWIFDIDFLIGERMYPSINYLGTLGYPQVIKQNCIPITHYI